MCCGKQNNGPIDTHNLILRTCEYYLHVKRDFADVIKTLKTKSLQMRRGDWVVQVGPI